MSDTYTGGYTDAAKKYAYRAGASSFRAPRQEKSKWRPLGESGIFYHMPVGIMNKILGRRPINLEETELMYEGQEGSLNDFPGSFEDMFGVDAGEAQRLLRDLNSTDRMDSYWKWQDWFDKYRDPQANLQSKAIVEYVLRDIIERSEDKARFGK